MSFRFANLTPPPLISICLASLFLFALRCSFALFCISQRRVYVCTFDNLTLLVYMRHVVFVTLLVSLDCFLEAREPSRIAFVCNR